MSGDQYGGYGNDPQYPAQSPAPATAPSYGQPGGAPEPTNQRPLMIALGAVIVAGLVVLVLAVSGVFSGGGSGGESPTAGAKAAVEKVLYASKRQNLDDIKAAVCKKDLTNPALSEIVGDEHASSYSIGEAKEDSPDRVTVSVRVTTEKSGTDSAELPVVREDGEWRVCFSDVSSTSSSASTPDPNTPDPSFSAPSSGGTDSTDSTFNVCASGSDAASTAKIFISFITLGSSEQAAACVADGKLSESQVKALLGDIYSPSQATGSGPQFTFTSATGTSTITVTVEKQSDGRYYVTAASKS